MSTLSHRNKVALVGLVLSLSFLGGCATTTPRDPLEPMNRVTYSFNDGVDQALFKPIAEGYRAVVPNFARTGISNFFANINDVLIVLNNLLQGKIVNAISDLGRVVVNSTIGVLGFMDLATEFGLEKHNEDFGQTLGHWGIGAGAYLLIPFMGPSNMRDAVGRFVDHRTDPITYVESMRARNVLWGVRMVSQRADLLDTSKILDAAALDPYEFLRDAFLQRRRNLVHDGSPPPDKDDDGDIKMKSRTELMPGRMAAYAAPAGTPWNMINTIANTRSADWTPAREDAAQPAKAIREPARDRAVETPVILKPHAGLETLLSTAPTGAGAGNAADVRQPQVVRVWLPQTAQ